MAHISDLPNEILLLVFPLLALQSLIGAMGVNHRWRMLISAARVDPTRQKLLEFYLHAIASPAFLQARTAICSKLVAFDREAYIANLPRETPDEFRLWVLEWPARAVIGCLWPGLQKHFNMSQGANTSTEEAVNCLAVERCPQVRTTMLRLAGNCVKVRALKVFDEGNGWHHWFVLDSCGVPKGFSCGVYSRMTDMSGLHDRLEADGWLSYLRANLRMETACLE